MWSLGSIVEGLDGLEKTSYEGARQKYMHTLHDHVYKPVNLPVSPRWSL